MDSTTSLVGNEVSNLLAQIQTDLNSFESENRSTHREPLVMPVEIATCFDDSGLNAFTRNLSTNGLCLIAPQPFRTNDVGEINFLSGSYEIPAKFICQWNKKFGASHWISGWQTETNLPVGKLLKEDSQVEPPQASRSDQRITTAIPLRIKDVSGDRLGSGFTRNLSYEGLSVVSKSEFQPGASHFLEILQLNGTSAQINASCMWSLPYAGNYLVSGWQILHAP